MRAAVGRIRSLAVGAALCLACGCAAPSVASRVTIQTLAADASGDAFRPTETLRVYADRDVADVRWKVNRPDGPVVRAGRVDASTAERLFVKLDSLGVWRLRGSYDPAKGEFTLVKIARGARTHDFVWQEGSGKDAEAGARIVESCRAFADAHTTRTIEPGAEPSRSAGQ